MTELPIRGFLETSFLDWDGKIVSVVFIPDCNFRCPFCHNSGLIDTPDKFPLVPAARIEKYLIEHRDFIDGVCFTGGEPCLHDRQLSEFIKRIRELGFLIKLDTNGTRPEAIRELLAEHLLDYIAMDIKGPLDERYSKLAGVIVDLAKIKESIQFIMKSGVAYEFRTTVIPGLINDLAVAAIAGAISGARKYVLQQFVPENSREIGWRALTPYPKEKLEELVRLAGSSLPNVRLRGA